MRVGARVQWRVDAAVLAALALGLRIPAMLSSHHLTPDDGVYGMSAIAMRAGGIPFRDVFSSQGPLHLPLVYFGDLLRTHWSPRVSSVVAGVACVVVTYAIARRISDRRCALVAGALVATSGSMLWTTGPIASDGMTAAFVAAAFLAALRYADAPSEGRAATVGVLCAAAVLVKPALGALGVVPAVWVVARQRRSRHLVVATVAAAVLAAVLVVAFGPREVWDQAIRFQLHSHREHGVAANAHKVVSTLIDRDIGVLVVLATALVATAARRTFLRRAGVDAQLALWLLPTLAFVVVEPALWRPHLAALIVPLALIAVSRPGAWPWLLVAALAIAPVQAYRVHDIVDPAGPTRSEAAAVATLRRLPPDAQVISDEVGLVWDSGRRTPDGLVDMSIKRFQQHRVDAANVAAAAARPPVCAVLVFRSGYLDSLSTLPARLAAEGYSIAPSRLLTGSGQVLYLRGGCRAALASR